MKKKVLGIVIGLLVFWVVAYGAYVSVDLLMGKPIQKQALDAYQRGDYAAALPLFKKWGEMPAVRNDRQQQMQILAYIVDCQTRLAAATHPAATGAAIAGPASGPADQNQLMQQAMSYIMDQNKSLSDPSTGAERIPHQPIPSGQTAVMTIKQLGNFEFDPVTQTASDVPADVKALDGARVRLNGFMYPLTQADAIDKFALVPTLGSCCFGQPPGVQHVVTVTMEKGKTAAFTYDEMVVEGVLHVNIKRQDGYTYQIFELTGMEAKVKEN